MKEKFKLLVNKFKEFNRDTYGMLITVSWILLVICLVIKLFGGNWFELWWDNEKFIAACNYVENNTILKRIIAILVCLFTTIPVYCIMLNEKKPKLKIMLLLIALTIIKSIIGWYNTNISFCLDIFILLILMTLLNKKFKRNLICFGLVSLFQIISILLRNVSFNFNIGNTVIENTLIQVDYYLMILLFYLYNFKIKKRREIK